MEGQILDAARSCVLEFGVRRTTLAEIARRAGVSRPTVYRRWPDTRAVVADLMTREIAAAVPAMDSSRPARAQLVDAACDVAHQISTHPMFVTILKFDQDLFGTYVFDRLGTSQKAGIAIVEATILVGQTEGSVRQGNARHIATMMLLIVQSVVQSARMVKPEIEGEDMLAELRHAVDSYLAPVR